jgi:anti-sigma factor RsiW
MRCAKTRTLIDDHADGLLPTREAELVRDHIEACAGCRDLAFAAKAASASLSRWGDLDPPQEAFDRILARVESLPPESLDRPAFRAPRPAAWRRLALPAGLAAAAALFAVVATSPFLRNTTPATATTFGGEVATTARDGLRPGETFVARDPDDPALRRRPTPVRYGAEPSERSLLDEQPSPVLPAAYDPFRPVR